MSVPENDTRQTMMLRADEVEHCADAWLLADYGDGYGVYALTAADELLVERRSSRDVKSAGGRFMHRRPPTSKSPLD